MNEAKSALIGASGFVGSTLASQGHFSALFGSRNIGDAHGGHFSDVFCAAAPGSMFEANRLPKADGKRIDALMGDLSQISADRFILLSTIAVFASFDAGCDESADSYQTSLAYGYNRRRLEEFCVNHFRDVLVVRLPALFGPGLRKNFVFDILNPLPSMLPIDRFDALRRSFPKDLGVALAGIYSQDERLGLMVVDRDAIERSGLKDALNEAIGEHDLNAVHFTNPESRFQYYDMSRLMVDIGTAQAEGLATIHLAPEPVAARDVYRSLVGREMPMTTARIHREDLRTRHAGLWGRSGRYISTADEVLEGLRAFHRAEGHTG